VTCGLPGFLQWYDARFNPQETILTLDYPILKDLSGLVGIDAVLEYGRCIAWEQAFLRSFDREWVRRSLTAYSGDPSGMIENLCSILLPDLIGHVVLKKPLKEIGYSQEEYRILADGFAMDCLLVCFPTVQPKNVLPNNISAELFPTLLHGLNTVLHMAVWIRCSGCR
jgi:hypothetical protein